MAQSTNEVVILSSSSMEELAHQVVTQATGHGWAWRTSDISWKFFPDETPNLFVNVEGIRGKDVVFLACFHNAQAIFAQLALIYAIPSYMVRSLTVVLPYFPTGTMERVDEEGQIATAKTLARMLSIIPITNAGPTRLICFDIHALQERFYFSDDIIPLLPSAVPLLIERLRSFPDDVAIVFPDDGACKRFGKLFPMYPVITCAKVRDGDARIVRIKEGNPTGKHCFIVDDLVQTGGTLIECKEALVKHGAAKVSAYVTHAIFPRESWRRFVRPLEGSDHTPGFEHFFVTDSCPETTKHLVDKAPFEVLPIAGKIVENVHRFVTCFH